MTITSPRPVARKLADDITLTIQQIRELGIEEAPADIGPSWEEYRHQKQQKGNSHVR